MPARQADSWPAPWISFARFTPDRIYRVPLPWARTACARPPTADPRPVRPHEPESFPRTGHSRRVPARRDDGQSGLKDQFGAVIEELDATLSWFAGDKATAKVDRVSAAQLALWGCGHRTQAQLPPGVPRSPFGPRLQARAGRFTGRHRLSRREAQQLRQDLWQVRISLGGLSKLEGATTLLYSELRGWISLLSPAFVCVCLPLTVSIFDRGSQANLSCPPIRWLWTLARGHLRMRPAQASPEQCPGWGSCR